MEKVIFLDTVHPILEEKINHQYTCIHAENKSKEECLELIKDVVGIVIRSRFRMDSEFLENAKNLKFIARSGAGMENIDVNYCENRNIQLINAPEGNRNAVAEHALGMLLSLMNNLNSADKEVRKGLWRREENRGIELSGKTVGIIGFGNNGSAFAKVLGGFNIKILAYDKYKNGFGTDQITECQLEELYENSDVISFHIPQNEETIHWADDEFFKKVKKPFYLLNLSRGKIVKTESLLKALKSREVLGAGLDVFEYEKASFEQLDLESLPREFQELLQTKNTIFTPHVGGWTAESYYKLSDVLAEKILGNGLLEKYTII